MEYISSGKKPAEIPVGMKDGHVKAICGKFEEMLKHEAANSNKLMQQCLQLDKDQNRAKKR